MAIQTESPADQDMFRGSSHEKVAENVAQIIRTPDVNIIGLEGELGSGKSTILRLWVTSLNTTRGSAAG